MSVHFGTLYIIVMFCLISYYLYNLRNVKKTHDGALFLVKLQDLLKVTVLYGCFLRFLNYANGRKPRSASHIIRSQLSNKVSQWFHSTFVEAGANATVFGSWYYFFFVSTVGYLNSIICKLKSTNNQWCIQNPVRHLRWSFLWKCLLVESF